MFVQLSTHGTDRDNRTGHFRRGLATGRHGSFHRELILFGMVHTLQRPLKATRCLRTQKLGVVQRLSHVFLCPKFVAFRSRDAQYSSDTGLESDRKLEYEIRTMCIILYIYIYLCIYVYTYMYILIYICIYMWACLKIGEP